MDVIVEAITEVVPYLVSPLIRHGSYLVHYKRNVNDLKKKMAILRQLKVDVLRSVGVARMRGEVIREVVEGWLTRVIQMQFSEIALNNALEDSKGCLQRGCCGRYQVGKDAKQMIEEINELLNEGRTFDVVSDPAPLPSNLEIMQTLDFQVYDSTKLAMDEIRYALKHDDVNTIGVYGLGGVGKTTLMKEVAKNLIKDGLFYQVVMVTVSQDPIWTKIQGEIAENLGLPLKQESPSVRARLLLERLNKEKRILIVLDDLWKPLNLLEQVGIPCRNNCKVVLTTRQLEVCNQMETELNVEVKVLSEKDSWVLFKWAAGDHIEDQYTLHPVAKQIVRECGGLPLAIVTIGRALRAKDRYVWEDAASQLKKSSSPPDIEGMHEKVFCSIKLSYDFLASEATKFCFLLCCMFPEDCSISENDLLPYVVGEGVFGDIDSLMEAKNRLHTQIERLKRSCLLLEDGRRKGLVRMHDVVRDVSIWIASKEGHDFLVKSGRGLTHFPERENLLSKCKRLSLMQNRITKLPNRLDFCSQFMTLSFRDNEDLTEIPDGFFQGMISLKTLDLEGTNISSIPSSLSCLTDLRVLCISRYRWSSQHLDVSLLGKLKKLEILHLKDSDVENLPEEIGELTNLKSLNLSTNPDLTIAPNTLSKLSLLEELDLEDSFHDWQIEGSLEDGISKAYLSEFASFSTLTTLNINVSNIKCLYANIPFRWENLKRFIVTLGTKVSLRTIASMDYSFFECTTSVYIFGSSITPFANWVRIYLLERAEVLRLEKCLGFQNVLSLGVRGLNKLQILHVSGCDDMEYLLSTIDQVEDEVPQIAFSSLEQLYLMSLLKMKAICHGSLPSGVCFNNLRFLYFRHCYSLISIITFDLIAKLPNLEELKVEHCSNVTEVFNSVGLNEGPATMTKLKLLDLRSLSSLRTIWVGIVSPLSLLNLEEVHAEQLGLKSMFSLAMAQRHQQLKQLEIRDCPQMVQIISMEGDENSTNNLCSSSLLPTLIFGNIRRLVISRCKSLKHILPMSLAQGLLQLEVLSISECPNLEEIIVNDDIEKEAMCKMVFPRLTFLGLRSLSNLSMVSKGVLHHDWPLLGTLNVSECPNLKKLPVDPQTAVKLQEIIVEEEWFNGLEWDDQNDNLHLQERVKVIFLSAFQQRMQDECEEQRRRGSAGPRHSFSGNSMDSHR